MAAPRAPPALALLLAVAALAGCAGGGDEATPPTVTPARGDEPLRVENRTYSCEETLEAGDAGRCAAYRLDAPRDPPTPEEAATFPETVDVAGATYVCEAWLPPPRPASPDVPTPVAPEQQGVCERFVPAGATPLGETEPTTPATR